MAREAEISIVEDDESLRAALVGLIRSLGRVARGFGSAEEFFDRGGPACGCVITDIHLPGESGIDLARRMRADDASAPIIMITARADADLAQRAMAAGALCVLTKPFDTQLLIAWLERALGA